MDAEDGLNRRDKARQFTHVVIRRFNAATARQVRPDAMEAQRWLPENVAHGGMKIVRHDALTQVAEFDHNDHVVDSAADSCGGTERSQDVDIAVDADGVRTHDAIDLAGHRGTNQHHWGRDVGVTHPLDVFDARVTERRHSGVGERASELGFAEQGLGHCRDRDSQACGAIHDAMRVVADLVKVDVEMKSVHRAATGDPCKSGNAADTMSTRRSVGRVRASVAGIPSSTS